MTLRAQSRQGAHYNLMGEGLQHAVGLDLGGMLS